MMLFLLHCFFLTLITFCSYASEKNFSLIEKSIFSVTPPNEELPLLPEEISEKIIKDLLLSKKLVIHKSLPPLIHSLIKQAYLLQGKDRARLLQNIMRALFRVKAFTHEENNNLIINDAVAVCLDKLSNVFQTSAGHHVILWKVFNDEWSDVTFSLFPFCNHGIQALIVNIRHFMLTLHLLYKESYIFVLQQQYSLSYEAALKRFQKIIGEAYGTRNPYVFYKNTLKDLKDFSEQTKKITPPIRQCS